MSAGMTGMQDAWAGGGPGLSHVVAMLVVRVGCVGLGHGPSVGSESGECTDERCYTQGVCITSALSVDGRALTVDDRQKVANCRILLVRKGCAHTGRGGRNIDTSFSRERRVARKPRALAVGIPTEVDR